MGTGEVNDSVGGRPATHYFKLFIRDVSFRKRILQILLILRIMGSLGTSNSLDLSFIPAYKPNDVVDVYEHPFTIERPAWENSPLGYNCTFLMKETKPVDIVHLLSIFSSTSSRYDQGVERLHEIEIDRNTNFSLSSKKN